MRRICRFIINVVYRNVYLLLLWVFLNRFSPFRKKLQPWSKETEIDRIFAPFFESLFLHFYKWERKNLLVLEEVLQYQEVCLYDRNISIREFCQTKLEIKTQILFSSFRYVWHREEMRKLSQTHFVPPLFPHPLIREVARSLKYSKLKKVFWAVGTLSNSKHFKIVLTIKG